MTKNQKNYELFLSRLRILHEAAPQLDLSLIKDKAWNLLVDGDPDIADPLLNTLQGIDVMLRQQSLKLCINRRMIKQIGEAKRRIEKYEKRCIS